MIFILLFIFFRISLQDDDTIIATVYYKDGEYQLLVGKYDLDKGIVAGTYQKKYEKIGWDYLDIESTKNSKLYNDGEIEFATGFLEGYFTHERIHVVYQNAEPFILKHFNFTLPGDVKDFLTEQRKWVNTQDPNDPFWKMAMITYEHLDGVLDGYNSISKYPLDYFQMYSIFSWGDILSLLGVIPSVPFPKGIYDDRCTGGIRYSKEDNDIYFSHTSWFMYPFNIRIFKSYNIRFNNPLLKAETTYFSSYPATPTSSDDFYVTSSDLFVLETTLSCFNTSMAKMLTPKSLLYWQRLLIANRFSETATDWAKFFSKQNGGTYNDEFIVLDAKKAQIGLDSGEGNFPENTLVLLDQIPGYIEVVDVTKNMESMGYFPSYNVPYSTEVYKRCDFEEYIKKNPEEYNMLDYNNCARSKIFKRDAPKINSYEDFKKFMRYNDYLHDPLSLGHATYAICARFDLGTPASCGGGYDSKVVSVKTWKEEMKISIISGPMFDEEKGIPEFKYSTSKVCEHMVHFGQPDSLTFDWEVVSFKK